MQLWKLELLSGEDYEYDTTCGMIVRAETEIAARAMASVQVQNDLSAPQRIPLWTDATRTCCIPVPQDGPAEVILVDFLNG